MDFIAVNLYPGWDGSPWSVKDYQPLIGGKPATPQGGFDSFKIIYAQLVARYPGLPVVVTETGWPTTYGLPSPPPPQPATGIPNAAGYLKLVEGWAASEKKAVFIYGMRRLMEELLDVYEKAVLQAPHVDLPNIEVRNMSRCARPVVAARR